jgi:hypothetical protein
MSAPDITMRLTVKALALLAMAMTLAMTTFGCFERDDCTDAILRDLGGMDAADRQALRADARSLNERLGVLLMEHMVASESE